MTRLVQTLVVALNPRLTLQISTYDELRASEDLKKFSDWALDRNRLDYLEPWLLEEKGACRSGDKREKVSTCMGTR